METVDIAVIGAGFAGLAAAAAVAAAGRSVVVLEARDRVGGRSKAGVLNGQVVDVGGQWVGPGQDRLLAAAREFGIATRPQYTAGKRLVDYRGSVRPYTGLIPKLPWLGLIETDLALKKLKRMSATIPLDAPWTAPDAAALDSMTVETWKRRQCRTAAARTVLDIATRAVFTAEPGAMSMLFFLFYGASGGSFEKMASVEGGAQQDVFVGGAHQIAARMAERLGAAVRLNAPVRAIAQDTDGVTIAHDQGVLRARRAIMAIPPTLAGRIAYSPALPVARDALMQRMPMGSVIKVLLAYATPFWRARKLSGEAISDSTPLSVTFDASPPDGSFGAIVGFFDGAEAQVWTGRGQAARREAAIASLVRLFGPQAASPTDYVEQDWLAEEWSRGCYAAYMGPTTMTEYGHALRTPCGRLHWAGTETATISCGYLDGALRSGDHAAAEVLADAAI